MNLPLIARVQKLKKIKADRKALKARSKKPIEVLPPTIEEFLAHLPPTYHDFLKPSTYKAAFGGRASAKSHSFAEMAIAKMIYEPDLQVLGVRKYRESLTYSLKLLLERKIKKMGVPHLFDIKSNIIERKDGDGFVAFKGLQDHNAESVKSAEDFGLVIVEEATELDQRSLDMLIPTMRKPGVELWFLWNPDQPTDPVDALFRGPNPPKDSIIKSVSFRDNTFISQKTLDDEERDRLADAEKHDWVWLGGYNVKSDAIVFSGRWRIAEVDTANWDGPYYGADWGFANDPTALIEVWVSGNQIYVSRESYAYRLESDRIARRWKKDLPGVERQVIRGDNSRPETISMVKRDYRGLRACEKWPGCVEDRIDWLRSYEILVHPRCVNMQTELKRYRYKQNKGGDVLSQIIDKDNHLIDSLAYALEPLIKNRGKQYGESRARW